MVSKNRKRFYSQLDMAIIKKDIAARNSESKRGIIVKGGTEYISVCGCGTEGCFIHGGFNKNKFVKAPLPSQLL